MSRPRIVSTGPSPIKMLVFMGFEGFANVGFMGGKTFSGWGFRGKAGALDEGLHHSEFDTPNSL